MLQNIQQNMQEPSTKKKIAVIGAGFAGLASACSLAQKGFEVTLLEKNHQTGGRGRAFQHQGYSFDMGPSWYWMPEIFEQFFNKFGKKGQRLLRAAAIRSFLSGVFSGRRTTRCSGCL